MLAGNVQMEVEYPSLPIQKVWFLRSYLILCPLARLNQYSEFPETFVLWMHRLSFPSLVYLMMHSKRYSYLHYFQFQFLVRVSMVGYGYDTYRCHLMQEIELDH